MGVGGGRQVKKTIFHGGGGGGRQFFLSTVYFLLHIIPLGPLGGKSPMKTNLQNQNFEFLKTALNRLEPLPKAASRRELFESASRPEKGSFCVGI